MNNRYIPLTQQKYCCVPTCIQMVMYKNGIPLVSQESIGNALGLIVPEEDMYLFDNPKTGEMPISGWGTQIYRSEYSPNSAFKNLNIPLKMKLDLIDSFNTVQDIKEYLMKHQESNSDVLVCYDYGVLFDKDWHGGHVNVFDSFDIATGIVRLVDPEQNVPKYREVSVDKLFDALVTHGIEKSGGFWQIIKV